MNPLPPFDLIVFDLFGVIISEAHMVSSALMPLLPPDTDKDRVKPLYRDYTCGAISEQAFWQGIGQGGNRALRQRFLDQFALDGEVDVVVRELQPRYRLAVLSNLAADWADELIPRLGLARLFSPLVISGRVGAEKPEPAIYRHLLVEAGLPAERMLFIDDRLENLAAARSLFGMATVHLCREDDDFPFAPDFRIRRLGALPELIDGIERGALP